MFARAAGQEGDFQYSFNGSYFDTEGLDAPLEDIAGPAFAGATTKGQLENTEKYFNFSGKFKSFYFDASYAEVLKESYFLLPPTTDGTTQQQWVSRLVFGIDKVE